MESFPVLETDLLRTFVAINDSGSFRAAADYVFRTPSAISMQVKKLEDKIGRPVFERDARNLKLTPDGELLLGYARRILAISEEAMKHFHTPEIEGVVRVGAPDEYGERYLPHLLQRLSVTHPGLTIDVTIDFSSTLLQRLDEGALDLTLFTCTPDTMRPNDSIILEEKLAWAGLRGGTAHLKKPLPVSMWEESCAWRNNAVAALDKVGIPFRTAFMSAHTTGQRAAVLADLAIAPYPAGLIKAPLAELGAEHGLPPLGSYRVALREAQQMSSAATAVADVLKSVETAKLAA